MGMDLIEWTYDPLQALNAHLNFAKLGIVVEEYEENIYGESSSPLHRGTPTDRFIAEWRLREPHVERRIAGQGPTPVHAADLPGIPPANRTRKAGGWLVNDSYDLSLGDPRVRVVDTDRLRRAAAAGPGRRQRWRMATRAISTVSSHVATEPWIPWWIVPRLPDTTSRSTAHEFVAQSGLPLAQRASSSPAEPRSARSCVTRNAPVITAKPGEPGGTAIQMRLDKPRRDQDPRHQHEAEQVGHGWPRAR